MPERAIRVVRLGLSLCEAFSLPPRAIIKTKQIGILLAQMPFFVIRLRLRKRAFDATPYHKKSHNRRLCDLLCFVIRLGFAKMRCFAAVSCVLLVLLVLVNILIYNVINAFMVMWIGDNIPDFAR